MVWHKQGKTAATAMDALALAVGYGASSLPAKVLPTDQGFLTLRYLLVGGSVCFLLSRAWQKVKNRSLSLSDPLCLAWCAFGCGSLLSGAFHDLDTFLQGLWLLFGLPLFFFALLPRYLGNQTNLFTGLALAGAFTLFNAFSVIVEPDLSYPYHGVWANSNYIGILAATQAAGLFGLLSAALDCRRWQLATTAVLGLLASSLAMILLSGSRTSFLSFSACLMLFLMLRVRRNGPGILLNAALGGCGAVLVVCALGWQEPFMGLADGILNKQEKQGENVLSGRDEIWKDTILNSCWLGHGSGYFPQRYGIGPHNVVIGMLGTYGILAVIFFVIFAVLSVWRAWQHAWRAPPDELCADAPLMVVAGYWVLAMGEASGALGGGLSLAFYTMVGVILNASLMGTRIPAPRRLRGVPAAHLNHSRLPSFIEGEGGKAV
jgi:O-antigen ligase